MTQSNTPVSSVAREVLWNYTVPSEESLDKDFYAALKEHIAIEIARRIGENTRIWVGREIQVQVGVYSVLAHLANIEPMLATTVDKNTAFLAHYHPRAKDEGQEVSKFIAETIRYPNERMEAVFDSLVGLDAIKVDLVRKLNLLLKPGYLVDWLENNYPYKQPQTLLQIIRDRYPLFILEGEVGSGKTALARSVGSRVASRIKSDIILFVVNAQVRGGGHVGEVTQNISRAFDEAERRHEREQVPVIVLIDEADSLAQSRGNAQTHHEDDAGVNTLIQRIDRLRGKPVAVIFATNLAQSLDSAILRRASATYHFERPSAEQRAEIFRRILTHTSIAEDTIAQLVDLTEPRTMPGFGSQHHRYTYSDLSQRLLPRAIEEAIYSQKQPLSAEHLFKACQSTLPTPEARHSEQPSTSETELLTKKRRTLQKRKLLRYLTH